MIGFQVSKNKGLIGVKTLRYVISLTICAVFVSAHIWSSKLSSASILNEETDRAASASFDDLEFYFSSLPRLIMAILIGSALGFAGSILQQLSRNRLVSPMTIGASSGAWLALVCTSVWFPSALSSHGHWLALSGALAAVALVILIAGRTGFNGTPIVLAGMTASLLFGAIATAITLINSKYTLSLFVWGAGNLAQIDWRWVEWLWPKLMIVFVAISIAPRALTLLQIGSEGARSRGLWLWPIMLSLFLVSAWLTAISVTAVGLIGFIGLLAPNLAKLLGARGSRDELIYSALIGSMLLMSTDSLALILGSWTGSLIPSGITAALIGAPALIWLCRRQIYTSESSGLSLPDGAMVFTREKVIYVFTLFSACIILNVYVSRGVDGWIYSLPNSLIWSVRWPKMLMAASAGAGLAMAGVILQRLLRNPLASPDVLGLSAGATLAVISLAITLGNSLFSKFTPFAAFFGCLAVLFLLLAISKRHNYSPGVMTLVGISLGALLNGGIQFGLAKGTPDAFAVLGWVAGSTYRATAGKSIAVASGICILGFLSIFYCRALTLISLNDGTARSRGLNIAQTRLGLLLLVALICTLIACLMGPISFIGLLAPHMATLLGARNSYGQLILSATIGALIMMFSDWTGRVISYPMQVPAGIVASVICGTYFLCLLVKRRLNCHAGYF